MVADGRDAVIRKAGQFALPLPAGLTARLHQLADLEPGWDGSGAPPPTPWAIDVARDALQRLGDGTAWAVEDVFVVPSAEGGIRLEWVADNRRELTVIIPPDTSGMVEFYRFSADPALDETIGASDLAQLPDMLAWLCEE